MLRGDSRFARKVGLFVVFPLCLYFLLRPENYGLTPNSLDPMFYSGYAINLDDLIQSVGQRHYFVSRWSSYLPNNLASLLLGPFAGRLAWRLILASLILSSLWKLGSRWSWNTVQKLFIGTVILSTPMFLRAFFTDYVEYLIVALGIMLVCLCLQDLQRISQALGIGLLSALILIANPVTITIVVPSVLAALVFSTSLVRRRFLLSLWIGGIVALISAGGFVYFRLRYGLDNVYSPSLAFVRNYKTPTIDDWRSPRLDWLGRFTWIYIPPVIVACGIGLAKIKKDPLDRVEKIAYGLCMFQYGYQWFDQFVRRGYGLELSYYWAYCLPVVLVALSVLLGRITDGVGKVRIAIIAVWWLGFLIIGVPRSVRLPAGIAFAALLFAALAFIAFSTRKSPSACVFLLVTLIGWMQIGAPPYKPLSYMILDNSPRYGELIRQGGNISELIYEEAVWFSRQMDRVQNDPISSFVTLGPWGSAISGLYAPHVTGRLIKTGSEGVALSPTAVQEILGGFRPTVVVFGPPDEVQSVVSQFPSLLGVGRKLQDETHREGLRYRLVVYSMPSNRRFPFTWQGNALPKASGQRVGQATLVTQGDAPGFATFGPYVMLPPAAYDVELSYRSRADRTEEIGVFDISSPDHSTKSAANLRGTMGARSTSTLRLTVERNQEFFRWEFRTSWNGVADLTVESITIRRL